MIEFNLVGSGEDATPQVGIGNVAQQKNSADDLPKFLECLVEMVFATAITQFAENCRGQQSRFLNGEDDLEHIQQVPFNQVKVNVFIAEKRLDVFVNALAVRLEQF